MGENIKYIKPSSLNPDNNKNSVMFYKKNIAMIFYIFMSEGFTSYMIKGMFAVNFRSPTLHS